MQFTDIEEVSLLKSLLILGFKISNDQAILCKMLSSVSLTSIVCMEKNSSEK